MHHYLPRPDWLDDLNNALDKQGVRIRLDFDRDFVLVENDWASGYEPEDVADKVAKGEHKLLRLNVADVVNAAIPEPK